MSSVTYFTYFHYDYSKILNLQNSKISKHLIKYEIETLSDIFLFHAFPKITRIQCL